MKRGPIAFALAASLVIHLALAVLLGRWFPGELGTATKPATLPEMNVVVLREAESAPAARLPASPKPSPRVSSPPSRPARTGALASTEALRPESRAAPAEAPDIPAVHTASPSSDAAPSRSEAPAMAPGSSAEAGRESMPSPAQVALVQASYLRTPLPPYPPAARRLGQHGVVLVRVYVNREGRPDEVRLARSSGVEALDEAALGAVSGWRFAPARRGAEPVASWIEVPVRFRLE